MEDGEGRWAHRLRPPAYSFLRLVISAIHLPTPATERCSGPIQQISIARGGLRTFLHKISVPPLHLSSPSRLEHSHGVTAQYLLNFSGREPRGLKFSCQQRNSRWIHEIVWRIGQTIEV